LSGNAFEGAGCEVVAWLSSNRNATWPVWMFVLPVAAAGGDKHPASLLQGLHHSADLHPKAQHSLLNHFRLSRPWPASVASRKTPQESKPGKSCSPALRQQLPAGVELIATSLSGDPATSP